MEEKFDWKRYKKLAAGVVGCAREVDKVKYLLFGKTKNLSSDEQDELKSRFREEGSIGDVEAVALSDYMGYVCDSEHIAKSNPVAGYIQANCLKRLNEIVPEYPASLQSLVGDGGVAKCREACERLIYNSGQQLTSKELEAAGQCITNILAGNQDRLSLSEVLAYQNMRRKLEHDRASLPERQAPKQAELQGVNEKRKQDVRTFWVKIFQGWRSEWDKQAAALEKEIVAMQREVDRQEAKISRQRVLLERDAFTKHWVGEFVKDDFGEDYYNALDKTVGDLPSATDAPPATH